MKRNLISILLLSLSMISCSTEQYDNEMHSIQKKSFGITNTANPFGNTGSVFGEIYEQIIDRPGSYTISELLTISLSADSFTVLYGKGYALLPDTDIAIIANEAQENFSSIAPYLGISDKAFTRLSAIAEGMQGLKRASADYESAVDFLSTSELAILAETELSDNEKEMLLTTTSCMLARLDVEKRKRRKDRDWELSIGHIAATAYGAKFSPSNAVICGLVSLMGT